MAYVTLGDGRTAYTVWDRCRSDDRTGFYLYIHILYIICPRLYAHNYYYSFAIILFYTLWRFEIVAADRSTRRTTLRPRRPPQFNLHPQSYIAGEKRPIVEIHYMLIRVITCHYNKLWSLFFSWVRFRDIAVPKKLVVSRARALSMQRRVTISARPCIV